MERVIITEKQKGFIMKKNWETAAMFLLILSGIFWGSIGLFEFDILGYFAEPCWFTRLVYFLFGASAVYIFIEWRLLKKMKK